MEDLSHYNPEGSTLRKSQLRMLEILIEIDKICKKHNINYWLDGGTLLGAVRHGGFIPWDDDLDICVPFKDYRKFRKAIQTELPDNFVFTDWTTDKYFFDYCARIKDKNSIVHYLPFSKQNHQGLWVDVCIVEKISVPIKKFLYKTHGRVFRQLHNVNATKNLMLSNFIKKFIAFAIFPFVYLLLIVCRAICSITNNSYYTYNSAIKSSSKYNLEDLKEKNLIYFEGKYYNAPQNPENYLTSQYGDYMQLPKEEERIGHNVKIDVY